MIAQRAGRRAISVEYLTLGWNSLEAAVAVASGISATVVLLRLRSLVAGNEPNERKERRALQVVAVCFYALAVYVLVDAAISLALAEHPTTSPAGIAITAAALVVMPALAAAKHRISTQLDADAATVLRADAAETVLCAVLAATTLLGVGLDTAFGWWWADPAVSLAVVYCAVKEGREAWAGELDRCIED